MNPTFTPRYNGAAAPGQPLQAEWDQLAPGFSDPVHDAQAVFRVLLDAFARPGRIYDIDVPLAAVNDVPGAALAALFALCDGMTPVWLQRPDAALAAALRFHTGAPLAATPGAATFAWIDAAHELPPLDAFAAGSAETPEHSSTVLMRVESLTDGPPVRFCGPGIRASHTLAPGGLRASFWQERAELAPLFPCGIDFYLICGARLVGLPRTTRVEVL
jgi:alpha-D-ribose 1-methylphosphonate 5-triphosphate synthase subunit PhnH